MNADRRQTAMVCVELLKECNEIGLIRDESHQMLVDTVEHLRKAEFWQLHSQSKWEGKNATTDLQLAVSRVALPAFEAAIIALGEDDFEAVIEQLTLAVTTDGTAPKETLRKDLVKARR